VPFLLRTNDFPTLATITQIPQIVIVDQTGPTIPIGASNKAVCVVGEFLKGPYVPTEVTSGGELFSLFGGLVAPASNQAIISQSAVSAGTQDGTQVGFNGNGVAQLKGRKFSRLVIQRVDCEAVTTGGGTTKATITITVGGTPSPTTQDILIPAGTRFGDNATPASATAIVATSQDYTIAKGATLPATVTANVFFVKGTTIAGGSLTAVIDSAIPSAPTTTTITTVSTGASNLFPPGTGGSLSALISSNYAAAIDKTLPSDEPMTSINTIWTARNDSTIRPYIINHAINASASGPGRKAIVAADPATANTVGAASTAKTAAEALASTESYVQPADRGIITFPHVKLFADELGVNITICNSGWIASIMSNRPEEENPGCENQALTNAIQGYEDAFVTSPLQKQDYINLKAAGVSAMQHDRSAGWWYVDGVTAANPVLYPTRAPIKRRAMADLIEDTLFELASKYNKKPATIDRVDAFVAEIDAFLSLLKSVQNPSLQRIVDYKVDPKSGNTATLQKLGIQVIIVAVQLLPGMDDIVLQAEIGETVDVSVIQ